MLYFKESRPRAKCSESNPSAGEHLRQILTIDDRPLVSIMIRRLLEKDFSLALFLFICSGLTRMLGKHAWGFH